MSSPSHPAQVGVDRLELAFGQYLRIELRRLPQREVHRLLELRAAREPWHVPVEDGASLRVREQLTHRGVHAERARGPESLREQRRVVREGVVARADVYRNRVTVLRRVRNADGRRQWPT